MTEYLDNIERLEVALKRALNDGSVVQFHSLALLLAQVPIDLRLRVQEAFDVHQPLDEDAKFYCVHFLVTAIPDGQWGVARCSGASPNYVLIIASNAERYAAAIQRIRAGFATQQQSIPLN